MPLNAIAYAIMKSMNNLRFGEEDYNNNDNLFRIPTSPKCFSVGSCKIDAQYSNNTIQCDTIRYDTIRYDIVLFLFPRFSFLYGIFYKRNRKHFSRVPIRYRNTRESLEELEIAWKQSPPYAAHFNFTFSKLPLVFSNTENVFYFLMRVRF